MKIFRQLLACIILLLVYSQAAHAVSTFGVMASGSDLDPESSDQDGGAGSSSASVNGPTYRSEASLNSTSTYLPTLKAESQSSGALGDDDFTQSTAQAYQSFTSSITQTIQLNISLDAMVTSLNTDLSNPFVLADIWVYGGSDFSVSGSFCSPGKFTFDSVYLCGDRLGWSNLFIDETTSQSMLDALIFDVAAGQNFGIYGILRANSRDGTADAFNTLSLNFEDDEFIRAVATPSLVPLPATAWLFATGMFGLIGFMRKKSSPLKTGS